MVTETGRAEVISLGGPVLEAEVVAGCFAIAEAVFVGARRLLGEVLRIDQRGVTVQIYEDTSGLRPGDLVAGTGGPLSVRLGPGLLGHIFDGLLRPLADARTSHVTPGTATTAPAGRVAFRPEVEVGAVVRPGMALGQLDLSADRTMTWRAPPGVAGRIVSVAAAGRYREDEVLAEVEEPDGPRRSLAMAESWPVRRPRPVARRLPLREPLFTGQRIIDTLYPVARGGRAAMPGGFGTGKTILLQTLAKWCDADVIVYIGCGERGNEMTGVLEEFPALEDPRTGRPLMERSVIIANTSNMPVAAREASIYTGVTVAEYFRDQGLHTALFADSTSRWAEALREISARLGELPAEGGYPAYLATRKAEFYERAGRASTLGGGEGSVTIVGAVSPPGGDFSEPVTLHTQRNVQCYWPLDRDRARARFYPAIHPLNAYTEYVDELSRWWHEAGNPDWEDQRRRLLELLADQAHLERMARIVGKDALPPSQRLTLGCAELVNESFLRQNAFSPVDRHASAARQGGMANLLLRFLALAEQAVAGGAPVDDLLALPVLRRLRRMGEDIDEAAAPTAHAALLSAVEQAIDGLRASRGVEATS